MLFCREFENDVIMHFLVLISLAKHAVGAICFAFCNYHNGPQASMQSKYRHLFSVQRHCAQS